VSADIPFPQADKELGTQYVPLSEQEIFKGMTKEQRHRRARQLDNRVVLWDGAVKGGSQLTMGRVEFTNPEPDNSRYFTIHMADGRIEKDVTLTRVLNRLAPENTKFELDRIPAVMASLASPTYSAALPHMYELHTPKGASRVLQALMPGPVVAGYEHRLARFAPGTPGYLEMRSAMHTSLLGHRSLIGAACDILMNIVNFKGTSSIVNLWSGRHLIAQSIALKGWKVTTTDDASPHSPDYEMDGLNPGHYRLLAESGVCTDLIVTQPPPDLLDFALPVALAHVSSALCALVPRLYLNNPSHGRRAWLAALFAQGRVSTIPLHDTNLCWLVLFAHPQARLRMLSDPTQIGRGYYTITPQVVEGRHKGSIA